MSIRSKQLEILNALSTDFLLFYQSVSTIIQRLWQGLSTSLQDGVTRQTSWQDSLFFISMVALQSFTDISFYWVTSHDRSSHFTRYEVRLSTFLKLLKVPGCINVVDERMIQESSSGCRHKTPPDASIVRWLIRYTASDDKSIFTDLDSMMPSHVQRTASLRWSVASTAPHSVLVPAFVNPVTWHRMKKDKGSVLGLPVLFSKTIQVRRQHWGSKARPPLHHSDHINWRIQQPSRVVIGPQWIFKT